jgi:hypothetical protein
MRKIKMFTHWASTLSPQSCNAATAVLSSDALAFAPSFGGYGTRPEMAERIQREDHGRRL